MEMTCGLGFAILLTCLLQAELAGSSWVQTGPNQMVPYVRLNKLSSSFQDQLEQRFSPRSVQTSSSKSNPAVNTGYDKKLSPRSFSQSRSQPVQSSGRLMKNPLGSKSYSQSTLAAQQGTKMGQRNSYSFRSPHSAAQEKKGSPATLFGPVASGPRSSVRMQTYAQGPARKVRAGRPPVPANARSFPLQAASGKSYLKPQFALNVGGGRPRGFTRLAAPRSSRVGESAPGYAPVEVHEIPETFGGFPIRRLGQQTEQKTAPVQKPQRINTPPPPQRAQAYNPDRTRIPSGSDRTRIKQNQRPVQKPHQLSTPPSPPSPPPPRWVPANNPDLRKVRPASTWTRVQRPYKL